MLGPQTNYGVGVATKHDVIEIAVDVEAAMANAGAFGSGLVELSNSYCELRPVVEEGEEGRSFKAALRVLGSERNKCAHGVLNRATGKRIRYEPSQPVIERAMDAGKFILSRLIDIESKENVAIYEPLLPAIAEAPDFSQTKPESTVAVRVEVMSGARDTVESEPERVRRLVGGLTAARATSRQMYDVPRAAPPDHPGPSASPEEVYRADLTSLKAKYGITTDRPFWTESRRERLAWAWEKAKGVGFWALERALKN